MKLFAIATVSLVIQSCSAGLWGSSKQDPVKAEEELPLAPNSKFDYKLSFKKNLYYNGSVPFWSLNGDVLKSPEFIRLSPSIPHSKGSIWSDIPNPYEEWEIEMSFKVTGNQMNGGRGLAFWYTKDKGQSGPIFGSKDKWDGLSIWLDSVHPKTHKPNTMAILNDGTLGFSEGLNPIDHMLGACSINFRNTNIPTLLKIIYEKNTIKVLMDNGSGSKDYLVCVKKSGIKLPTGYYFGISALSSTPADDHDIYSFETRQLNPPQKLQHPKRPLEEEKKKKGEEFNGIDEEQKQKIEEAEFQMRKLRENTEAVQDDTSIALGTIYETQRRAMDHLEILQMQIEALGAPTPNDAITGNYQKVDWNKLGSGASSNSDSTELNRIAEQIRSDSQKYLEQFEKISKEQNRKLNEVQNSVKRLEETLSKLDSRMLSQSTIMQKNMNEVKLHSAETKGSMSNLLKYVFYVFIAQFLFGLAGYLYWKMRVERNDKKFV